MAKEDEKKETFIEGEVSTQTQPVIVDTSRKQEDSKRVLTTEAALAQILNKLDNIEKAVLN